MVLKYLLPPLLVGLSVLTIGCGGSDDGAPAASTTLSGTAAAGAPIIGTVTVKGSLGVTKSALIEANGNYNVDVTGLTAPYRLRAQGTVGGRTYKLHSYAVEADVGGNVNITPFTDLIVANAAQQIAETYFDSNTPAELDSAVVDAQEDALQAKLQNVFTALGVDSAIDLLNSTFSADHSGLDAALDIISVEVDPLSNVATITNLIESTSITDSVVDTTDNSTTLTVTDPAALTTTMTDTQAIAAVFDTFTASYANGLPTLAAVSDYFSVDFLDDGIPKDLFLTQITTDPGMVGFMFSGVVVSNLTATTAEVTFSFGANGVFEFEPETWFVAKDATLGWQLRGNQRIVETYFSYHCNDYDGNGSWTGSCGINTQFWDEIFTDNPGGVAIASGTVSIIDGTDGFTVKDVVYLGTPVAGTAGDVQVYNEQYGNYQGDWKEFGTGVGQIDPAAFAVGDIIEYVLYTADLDITGPASPAIVGTPVATYTDTVLFVPNPTDTSISNKYPTATAATLTAMSNYTLGNNLTVAWTLAAGTRNSEILVEITDSVGNRVEIWDWNFGTTALSSTYSSTQLDSTTAGLLETDATYNLKVRIYAQDELTGQQHSRDYDTTIPGPAAGGTPPPVSGLVCGYESGWDDLADGGMGAPINPNSFAEYETLLADCHTPGTFTAAEVAGSSFVDDTETMTFILGGGTGTEASPGTGTAVDVDTFNFEWYVEAATCTGCTHNYLVIYADYALNPTLVPPGFWFRETQALINVIGTPDVAGAVYQFINYAEQSNYSDTVRESGSDAEIWGPSGSVLQ